MAGISFRCDYEEGCAPEILKRLEETNYVKAPGYGFDPFCESAAAKIRIAAKAPSAKVFFMSGGTQCNRTVIGGLLRPWEAVVAVDTGHINVHEAGAIESTGHRVIAIPQVSGLADAAGVDEAFSRWERDPSREHEPIPKMLYITHPTETGAVYSLARLEAVCAAAHRHGAIVYLDGARLAYALGATGTDVTIADIARLTDVFYIGGTKCGCLLGEALVFPKPALADRYFFTYMKQQGSVLAKGRVYGIQFDALFTDGLYEKLGRHADMLADRIREALRSKGYEILWDCSANQTFFRVSKEKKAELDAKVGLDAWTVNADGSAVLRACTSWASKEEDVEKLIAVL